MQAALRDGSALVSAMLLAAALPADWQEHRVLRHTARELGRMGGPQQLEG